MRHRMLLDMLLHLVRIEDDARVQENAGRAFHRVIVLHHGQHVAGRSDVGHLEAAEQIHRLKGEVHRRIHLVCQLQILGRLYLVREAPTTAVGWMLRPPTFVHSSLPSALRPSACSNSSGSV